MSDPSRFEKLSIALKFYCIGKGYTRALEALRLAKIWHDGFRKDGETPEAQHQIEIALYITTLKGVRDEENTIIVALLHDIIEDTSIGRAEIETRFGKTLADSIWAISKKINGVPKYLGDAATAMYYDDIARDLYASIVKPADRIHNNNSMAGVFTLQKQKEYVLEAEHFILPLIKKAEGWFPDQFFAYINAKHMLKSQIALVRNAIVGNCEDGVVPLDRLV